MTMPDVPWDETTRYHTPARVNNMSEKYTKEWYQTVEMDEITIEDAENDSNWHQNRLTLAQYVGIPIVTCKQILEDFTTQETADYMMALADYAVNGNAPDYGNDGFTSGVKGALRNTIADYEQRMNQYMLKQYKQFVGGKRKGQKPPKDT